MCPHEFLKALSSYCATNVQDRNVNRSADVQGWVQIYQQGRASSAVSTMNNSAHWHLRTHTYTHTFSCSGSSCLNHEGATVTGRLSGWATVWLRTDWIWVSAGFPVCARVCVSVCVRVHVCNNGWGNRSLSQPEHLPALIAQTQRAPDMKNTTFSHECGVFPVQQECGTKMICTLNNRLSRCSCYPDQITEFHCISTGVFLESKEIHFHWRAIVKICATCILPHYMTACANRN